MKHLKSIILVILIGLIGACSSDKLDRKGFQVSTVTETGEEPNGISKDSISFKTRPSNVLLTGNSEIRLTSIYMVNYRKKDNSAFIGSNYFYTNYSGYSRVDGNNWNNNLMAGFEAIRGYNLVNVSHHDTKTNASKVFFDEPVLIKTLYYPTLSHDTLNFMPINRNYFMVSVYDEDTNNDGYINLNDLRRFYFIDINGENKSLLIPKDYSVVKSEYDSANDYMYVFAQLDGNKNGKMDEGEDRHIFWIDLSDPSKIGRQY